VLDESVKQKVWTINTGGMPGLWRLFFLLEASKKQHRPAVIHAQEIRCGLEEWKATLRRISTLGYTAYASSNVSNGTKCK
jgi:dienelactone hydrolase